MDYMREITIKVSCHYEVEITADVKDSVYDELYDVLNKHHGRVGFGSVDNQKALKWLLANVSDDDSTELWYDIEDITDEEGD